MQSLRIMGRAFIIAAALASLAAMAPQPKAAGPGTADALFECIFHAPPTDSCENELAATIKEK